MKTTAMDSLWCFASERMTLETDEVHVWRASLNLSQSDIERFLRTLAQDERSRADRFYFQEDREHFIAARGVLRAVLGKYLQIDPGRLRFEYGSYGKPKLAEEFRAGSFCFNVSHSHGLAVYALSSGREVGVDVERIRSGFACERIAERFFSPQEVRALRSLPRSRQDEAFFNCWTRKEAYIKAKGVGVSIPLQLFDVSLVPGEPAALLSVRGDPHETSRWSLRDLFPGTGYVGALAANGQSWRLRCWQWPE
jgi:4'-phosphopantetheinyl transferase